MFRADVAQWLREEVFLTTDETFQDAIGTNRTVLALSDRRLYIKIDRWFLKREWSVDLQDVTAVSYTYVNPVYYLIIAAVVLLAGLITTLRIEAVLPFACALLAGLALVIVYLFSLRTVLEVEYPGGKGRLAGKLLLRGDASVSARDFLACLRYRKDLLTEPEPAAEEFIQ